MTTPMLENRSMTAVGLAEARLRAPAGAPLPLWKRAMDIALGLLALVLVSPLLLVIAVAIMLDSRGGVFYRHERVGRGGRTFTCWKFRSMSVDAEHRLTELNHRNEANGHIFKMRDDPRRTRVGRIIRRASLDELPQLLNVLRGEMSMVGPRPPLPSEVVLYTEEQLRRLGGTPGITGLWQVRARHRHDFEQMVRLDVEYLEKLTLWNDVRILASTVPTVLFGRGSY